MQSRELKTLWLTQIGTPKNYFFEKKLHLVRKIDHADFDGELYLQACGPNRLQKLLKLFPKKQTKPLPAVAVPFYHPDGMVGFELETGKQLERFLGKTIALDLVKRGFVTATADAYPFHFDADSCDLNNFHCPFSRYAQFQSWADAGKQIVARFPEWTGIGKLVADTKLLLDTLSEDERVDASRIGIAGHSLGGKMAFYAGCLDSRVKVILASDFGMGWDSTNWSEVWYWGDKLASMKQLGIDHSHLLTASGGTPFMLIAGEADNEASIDLMHKAEGYEDLSRLICINHATGHNPPRYALEQGYQFLEKWL